MRDADADTDADADASFGDNEPRQNADAVPHDPVERDSVLRNAIDGERLEEEPFPRNVGGDQSRIGEDIAKRLLVRVRAEDEVRTPIRCEMARETVDEAACDTKAVFPTGDGDIEPPAPIDEVLGPSGEVGWIEYDGVEPLAFVQHTKKVAATKLDRSTGRERRTVLLNIFLRQCDRMGVDVCGEDFRTHPCEDQRDETGAGTDLQYTFPGPDRAGRCTGEEEAVLRWLVDPSLAVERERETVVGDADGRGRC